MKNKLYIKIILVTLLFVKCNIKNEHKMHENPLSCTSSAYIFKNEINKSTQHNSNDKPILTNKFPIRANFNFERMSTWKALAFSLVTIFSIGKSDDVGLIGYFDGDCPEGFQEYTPLAGKVAIGISGSYPLGSTGGSETHILNISEIPQHSHSYYNPNNHGSDGSLYHLSGGPRAELSPTSSIGGGQPHNNMQPYRVLRACIKVTPDSYVEKDIFNNFVNMNFSETLVHINNLQNQITDLYSRESFLQTEFNDECHCYESYYWWVWSLANSLILIVTGAIICKKGRKGKIRGFIKQYHKIPFQGNNALISVSSQPNSNSSLVNYRSNPVQSGLGLNPIPFRLGSSSVQSGSSPVQSGSGSNPIQSRSGSSPIELSSLS